MAVLARYTLKDFSQPEPKGEEVLEPRFTAEEIEIQLAAARQAAREEGHAEGYERGHEAAMQSLLADQARALERLARSLEAIRGEKAELQQALEAQIEAFLAQLLRTLAPRLSSAFREDYLRELVQRAAQAASDTRRLRLLLPEGLGEESHQELLALARRESHDLTVEIEVEPDLPPGTAEACWEKGVMRMDIEAFAAALIAAVGKKAETSEQSEDRN